MKQTKMDKKCLNCKYGRNLGHVCTRRGVHTPIIKSITDCSLFVPAEVVKCYCIMEFNGNLHCPLSTDVKYLENTFNTLIGGVVVNVEINKAFVCQEERKESCKYCPFK